MDGAVLLLAALALLLRLSTASADVCFWSRSCTNRWVGGCGIGHVKVDQSDDCDGLCPPPRYQPCRPFSTHILCCSEETPIASDECSRCGNRVEVGDHWMCCSDCSEAKVSNAEIKTGFCRSGAQLSIQPKAREIFKWMSRDWSACSASCGDGIRRRHVHCMGSLEYTPKRLYYVNGTKCDTLRMPVTEMRCRNRPCSGAEHGHHIMKRHHRHRRGLHLLAKMFIVMLTCVGISGLVFGGYVLYQRRKESMANHGFVYVMLDNYS